MYRLYSFDGVTLPDARSEFEADTAEAWNGALSLPGGASAFDSLGAAQAPLVAPYTVQYASVVKDTSLSALETTLAAWRAKVGVRGTLRRRLLSAATYQDITARLLAVQMDVKPTHTHGKFVPIKWRFQVLDEYWRHATATSASQAFTTNPITFSVTNAGNAPARDAIWMIDPVDVALTAITINMSSGTYSWTYTGTIAVGDTLLVDTGARTVRTKAGVDVYSGFALNSTHVYSDWNAILPGSKTITALRAGGSANSTVKIDYYSKYV